ncbi:MAG TPA: hypothetical protein V6C89_10150 [Drouetiella sp.]
MKRFMIAAIATLGLALGIASPQAAKAAETVTCATVPGSNLGNLFKVCNGNSSPAVDTGNINDIVAAFDNLPQSSSTAVGTIIKNAMTSLYNNGVGTSHKGKGYYGTIYLFHSPAQWTAWANANGVDDINPSPTAVAYTLEDSTNHFQPYYGVIFEFTANGINNGGTSGGLGVLQANQVHEFGHWADYLYRGVASQTNVLSDSGASGMFSREIARDWALLNQTANYPCTPQNMNGGIFAGRADYWALGAPGRSPYFICNGKDIFGNITTGTSSNGVGPGLNTAPNPNPNKHPNYVADTGATANQKVLQQAWGYFFLPGYLAGFPKYQEFFAEAFANAWGPGVGTPGMNALSVNYDAYFRTTDSWPGFFCSMKWVNYVTTFNKLPTASSNYFSTADGPNPYNCPTN